MSERGVFATSYVYDQRPEVIEPLREFLRDYARDGTFEDHGGRWFNGLMHGGYPGEEADLIELWIDDKLLPNLPEKHGTISIMCLPESAERACVWKIDDRKVTRYTLREEAKA